jgi:capsular exopolysaccharide synthesis family protein
LALLLEVTDRRIRDEDELLTVLPAPILARSPIIPRRSRSGTLSPAAMPPAVREAFRTLRVQLERQPGTHRTIMLTSASSGDGKTTSAVNLALSLVGGGHRVLLIDFDLRKPDLARILGITPRRSLVATLTGTPLSELLTPAPQLPPLQVVPAASTEGDVALLESLRRRMPDILEEARALADYVVLDTAPLGEVSDALTIGDHVDDIIVVTRPGHTNRANLESVQDLLSSAGLRPTGLLVVGERAGRSRTHYTYGTGANGGSTRSSRRVATRSR